LLLAAGKFGLGLGLKFCGLVLEVWSWQGRRRLRSKLITFLGGGGTILKTSGVAIFFDVA